MSYDIHQIVSLAIYKIKPNAEFRVGSTYESLTWLDKTQTNPTEKEFNDAITAWNTEYDSQGYARVRQSLYPAIGDQLDDLYHSSVFSAEMTAKLKKVKDDNPK